MNVQLMHLAIFDTFVICLLNQDIQDVPIVSTCIDDGFASSVHAQTKCYGGKWHVSKEATLHQ